MYVDSYYYYILYIYTEWISNPLDHILYMFLQLFKWQSVEKMGFEKTYSRIYMDGSHSYIIVICLNCKYTHQHSSMYNSIQYASHYNYILRIYHTHAVPVLIKAMLAIYII